MSIDLAIETRGLTRRFGERVVVRDLDLAVPVGSIFGLLGPNGAGKSTILDMLCGTLQPTAGRIRVAGIDPARNAFALRQAIGYMPQRFSLYGYMTVAENLHFFANLYLESWRAARDRVAELMVTTGLADYRNHRADQLSGGWRQRLSLACALLHRPRILFLDEPTAAVDPISRRLFWDLVQGLNEEGVTVCVTTHYMEEVERCHLIGLLEQGCLLALQSPGELKHRLSQSCELIEVVCDRPQEAFKVLARQSDLLDIYYYGDALNLTWSRNRGGEQQTRSILATAGIDARLVGGRLPTMEDVFVRAMGAAPA